MLASGQIQATENNAYEYATNIIFGSNLAFNIDYSNNKRQHNDCKLMLTTCYMLHDYKRETQYMAIVWFKTGKHQIRVQITEEHRVGKTGHIGLPEAQFAFAIRLCVLCDGLTQAVLLVVCCLFLFALIILSLVLLMARFCCVLVLLRQFFIFVHCIFWSFLFALIVLTSMCASFGL